MLAQCQRAGACSLCLVFLPLLSCAREQPDRLPRPSEVATAGPPGKRTALVRDRPQPVAANGPRTGASAPTADARLGTSIYNLKASLVDQDGRAVGLDASMGHPVIISMFYSSCTTMCPLLITNVQRVEQALPEDVRKETRVLLVSLDPARDTPERLKALAEERNVDTARWRLLGTSDARVRELAAVLNVRYRRMPNGEIAHSSVVTVLDREGVPTLRVEDSIADPTELVRAVTAAHLNGARAQRTTVQMPP